MSENKILTENETCYEESNAHENEYARLVSALKDKSSKAIIYTYGKSISDSLISRFITENGSLFSKILYTKYNRNKYLYNKDMRHLGLDTVLKKCLSHQFIDKEITRHDIQSNYFSMFEDALDENTLLIIDDFDVASPTPYMRHLLSHECSLLIVSKNFMKSLSENVHVIDMDTSDLSESTAIIEKHISFLTPAQRELLMTLCGMLYYLEDETEIESSKSGIFDRESVKFYVGNLSDELDTLKDLSLIIISQNGKITITQEVMNHVISNLCPSPQNCKTFMDFTNKVCNFSVMQNYKDTYAKLSTLEGKYNSFISSGEMRDVYTYFCTADKDRGRKIYNMMTSMMLDRYAMKKGTFNCRHLLWKNRAFFLSLTAEFLRDQEKSKCIYRKDLYFDEPLGGIYSHAIKAELDIIRFCVTLIRNTTYDLYKESEYIFELLESAMSRIYEEVTTSVWDDDEKKLVIDDVIRLCYETFAFFRVMDDNGIYYNFRDNMRKIRVFYTCEKECDSLYASSVSMGYSKTTITLFATFQKYIGEYLRLTKNSYDKENIELLVRYSNDKHLSYKQLFSDISVHFTRLINGLDKFCDFYSEKNKRTQLWKFDFPSDIEKRLADNKRFLLRGFDDGTMTGAEKYAVMIIEAVKESDDPLRVILSVLDFSYPLGNNTYKRLLDKSFVKFVCEELEIPNLSKQIMLETLIDSYFMYSEKTELVKLYEHLICYLSGNITHNDSSEKRLFHIVSSMFVRHKLFEISQTQSTSKMTNDGFAETLYKEYCQNGKYSPEYCSDYIAKVLYNICAGNSSAINKKKLFKALKVLIFESACTYPSGISVISKELLGKGDNEAIQHLITEHKKNT